DEVIDAYLRGLSTRADACDPLDAIASVASFFLSRIDTKVDPQLADDSPLRGRVAIASARSAYESFKSKFAGPQWDLLLENGATPQRPLWASTGTKDPRYSDVLYVSELIGPQVVSTMPEQTLRAFGDHGEVARTLDADPQGAQATLADAVRDGVDIDAVTTALEQEGIQSFCASYHELLDRIETKLGALKETANASKPE